MGLSYTSVLQYGARTSVQPQDMTGIGYIGGLQINQLQDSYGPLNPVERCYGLIFLWSSTNYPQSRLEYGPPTEEPQL